MVDDFIYAVSRFDVEAAEEVLAEHAELVRVNENFVLRVTGTAERKLSTNDLREAIAGEPVLSEVRANQVTRIRAGGIAFDELPFALTVPGDPDDFDEKLWAKTQADKHTFQNWVVQPGRRRVAYVNGSRWCPWPTADGQQMLPEHWPVVDLSPTWARLTFSELASMTSGLDEITLGLVTPRAVAACHNPDSGSLEVSTWRRTGETPTDARIIVDWLLDWVPCCYGMNNEDFRVLLVQLFVEASRHGNNGSPLRGGELTAGWKTSLGFGDTDTSVWSLELNAPNPATSLALELIEQHGERLAAVAVAGRQPSSPEGRARLAAVADWHSTHPATSDESGADAYEDDEYEEAEEEDDEPDEDEDEPTGPWDHSPISRMPAIVVPGEIPIQFWRRYTRGGKRIGTDFVFSWNGSREVTWRYEISPDNPEKPALSTRWTASFHGKAAWTDGVNVRLSYTSPELGLSGTTTLDASAPTVMDPSSDERMKRPGLWVDLAGKIISVLDGLPS